MSNPFQKYNTDIKGPAIDIVPVTPSDTTDLATVGIGLFVSTGGNVVFRTPGSGATNRTVKVADNTLLPVGVTRVLATGTTATGIHVYVI